MPICQTLTFCLHRVSVSWALYCETGTRLLSLILGRNTSKGRLPHLSQSMQILRFGLLVTYSDPRS